MDSAELHITTSVIKFFSLTKEEREGVFYNGHTRYDSIGQFLDFHYWQQESDFSDGFFRQVFINTDEHAILTYCEGDLRLQICGNALDFYRTLASAAEFYIKH